MLLFAATIATLVSCTAKVSTGASIGSPMVQIPGPFERLMDPGGCLLEQLTGGDHDQYQVMGTSADGTLLVIAGRLEGATGDDTVYEVHEIELATGKKTDLSHALTNGGPYSPDKKFIVVAQETDNGRTDVFEYDRATGELLPVAAHENWDWLASYSPDGRFIVFNSYRVDSQSDIYLFERATGELTRLTDYPGYDAHGQFSPDGKRILFHRQQGTRAEGGYIFDLIVYDVATGEETRLTDGNYEESYAAWAPDGRHLVYSSDFAGKHGKLNLYVLAPNGETMARLTDGDWKDSYAFWSRDGKYIYFNSERAGASNVYRLLMDGIDCVREGA